MRTMTRLLPLLAAVLAFPPCAGSDLREGPVELEVEAGDVVGDLETPPTGGDATISPVLWRPPQSPRSR